MPITFSCTCGKQFRVADEHAGKTFTCKTCNTAGTVPWPAIPIQHRDGATHLAEGDRPTDTEKTRSAPPPESRTCPTCTKPNHKEAKRCRYCSGNLCTPLPETSASPADKSFENNRLQDFRSRFLRRPLPWVMAVAGLIVATTTFIIFNTSYIRDATSKNATTGPDRDRSIKQAFERDIRGLLKDPNSLVWQDGMPTVCRFICSEADATTCTLKPGDRGIIIMGSFTATNSFGGRISSQWATVLREDGTVADSPFDVLEMVKLKTRFGVELNDTIWLSPDRFMQGEWH